MPPTTEYEHELRARGLLRVAGVDEAGRGCWAGPVVAAAVILGPGALADPSLLAGVDDSKQLSAEGRERAFERVLAAALGVGVGAVPAYLIDAYGILPATRLAMQIALLSLPCAADGLLIDAVALPELGLPQLALVKGDARSLSIAAASVVAKVSRDRLMRSADAALPGYGFAAHKGYGTAAHARALAARGPSHIHRHSFRPLIELWYDGQPGG